MSLSAAHRRDVMVDMSVNKSPMLSHASMSASCILRMEHAIRNRVYMDQPARWSEKKGLTAWPSTKNTSQTRKSVCLLIS